MWITGRLAGAPVYISPHLIPQRLDISSQHMIRRIIEDKYPLCQVNEFIYKAIVNSCRFIDRLLDGDPVLISQYSDHVVFTDPVHP